MEKGGRKGGRQRFHHQQFYNSSVTTTTEFQGVLNSIDPLHPVSNMFRSEQGVYVFLCKLGHY